MQAVFPERLRFLELLTAAEQAVAAGAINEGFTELVRELSDLASGPMAQYLSIERSTRARWDAIWAMSDPEVLQADACAKARALIERAEEQLVSGRMDPNLAATIRSLRLLDQTFGLPGLFASDPDWLDRADIALQAYKEARGG